jgi:hypothetical protein
VWTSAKANVAELEKLREAQMQLQMRGIHADPSAAQFPLLTAKMSPKDVSALKKSFPRQGFVDKIEALESEAKKFTAELTAKQAATPSVAWKMLMSARPEVVLWVAYSTKNAALQAKFKNFYTEWPQARQKIPYVLMQEMRIVPGVAKFDELVDRLFFELMDGKLGTVEEMKAFLEPYSPPAPPPPVHLRRARAAKKEAKVPKSRKKAVADAASAQDADGLQEVAAAAHATGATAAKPSADKAKGAGSKVVEAKATAPVKAAVPAKHAGKAVPPAKAVAAKVPAKKPVAKKVPAKKVAAKPVVKKAAAKPVAKKSAHAKVVAKKVKPVAKKAAAKPVAKKAAPAKVVKKAAGKKPLAKAKAKKKK